MKTITGQKAKGIFLLGFTLSGLAAFTWLVEGAIVNQLKNWTARQSPTVRYVALNIGQGDATFLELPDRTQLLVDCGPDARILAALGRHMRFYDRTIDYLVVTHADTDHYAGCIDVLRRFRVKTVIYNGQQKGESEQWQTFWQTLNSARRSGARYRGVKQLESVTVGSVKFTFFYPDHDIVADPLVPGAKKPNRNNLPLVFKLSYGETDALFTADMEIELEEYLAKKHPRALDVEVLKVGHHGSDTSTGEALVKAATPNVATISVGVGNSYGHPSLRVMRRLARSGVRVLRTDTEGDIILTLTTSSAYVLGDDKKK